MLHILHPVACATSYFLALIPIVSCPLCPNDFNRVANHDTYTGVCLPGVAKLYHPEGHLEEWNCCKDLTVSRNHALHIIGGSYDYSI